jgi:putative transposase
LRDECLSANEFEWIDEARQKIEGWRVEYNDYRPHGALGHLTPSEYAQSGQQCFAEAADL